MTFVGLFIFFLMFSLSFAILVTSGNFVYRKEIDALDKKVCIIDSWNKLDSIRDTCDLKVPDLRELNNFCEELALSPDCECVKPIVPIRSACIGNILNSTIFQGQRNGTTLPCLPRGTELNWSLEWNITENGVDFVWCRK